MKTTIVAGRDQATVAFEAGVVEFFESAADLLGVPKSVAAIYGVVFASPVPLSFADIEARLGLSKGSVSQGLRALREVGALQEVSAPSDSTELFAADLEMRRLLGRFIDSRLNTQLASSRTRLTNLKGRLAALPAGDRKPLAQRLKKLQRWDRRTRNLLTVVRSFLDNS